MKIFWLKVALPFSYHHSWNLLRSYYNDFKSAHLLVIILTYIVVNDIL